MSHEEPWWKSGIIYQIYPRSYKDTTGNGLGDLRGIRQQLDYIKSLNVTAIWLSPIYPSPDYDFGYDVSDYTSIRPEFGTIDEFDKLIQEIHDRDMKLMLDFVPNHTSSEHPWFKEARTSKDNPKRDWYVWRDPSPDGGPPNNWVSFFGGPAWTLDKQTGQYYLHQFVPEQPELNYENPDLRNAMLDNMKFWLDKEVDGFRLDVIFLIKKDQRFLDEPLNLHWDGVRPWEKTLRIYTSNVEGVHDFIMRYRKLLDEYKDCAFLGEIYLDFNELVSYYGKNNDEIHLPSNTILLTTDWEPHVLKENIAKYFSSLPKGAWPNWQLGNHDQHRIVSRVGRKQARVAVMFLLTIWGTPITYYGEEIGMENVEIPPEKIMDPPAVNQPEHAEIIGRDPERTPMQWSCEPNAGFCRVNIEPWLPVGKNYKSINVEIQEKDPQSMLSYYKGLTSLRQSKKSLSMGSYQAVEVSETEAIMAYTRQYEGRDAFLIVLNFSSQPLVIDLSFVQTKGMVEISTFMDRKEEVDLKRLAIRADEGVVIGL